MDLFSFYDQFNTEEKCRDYLEQIRWNGIPTCPFCGCTNICRFKTDSRRLECRNKKCRRQFTVIVKTIFENNKVGLRVLFHLIYQFAFNKKSTSSLQSAKNYKVMQRTAWAFNNKVQRILSDEGKFTLSGVVEIDEMFLSRDKIGQWGAISTRKQPIIGMMERGGKVIVKCVPNRWSGTLDELILNHVEPGSTIYTDGWLGYKNLYQHYKHEYVNHSEGEYVNGDIHINSIEGFWGFLKKSLRGAHHTISPKHAQLYCDQIAYTWNYRHLAPIERFNDILSRCINTKAIRYTDIISKKIA